VKYHYFHDPAHGWIEVAKSKLEALGIHKEITEFSYMHGPAIYLEEDMDAPRFLRALEENGETYELIEHYSDRPSWIREYYPYSPDAITLEEFISDMVGWTEEDGDE